MAIETACSASLVALNSACKSLLNGECKLAIAGGVNIMLNPRTTISECKAHMLLKMVIAKHLTQKQMVLLAGKVVG